MNVASLPARDRVYTSTPTLNLRLPGTLFDHPWIPLIESAPNGLSFQLIQPHTSNAEP
jgi:hypothetical protein